MLRVGQGKTMALEVIVRGLRMSLYRVNLKHVASQYIGEAKKNVARVFEVAQKTGAVWIFYEVDALLGKRRQVRDHYEMNEMEASPMCFQCHAFAN
jgi:ATP-dependent 26S proteasome regulatory subunit